MEEVASISEAFSRYWRQISEVDPTSVNPPFPKLLLNLGSALVGSVPI